MCVCVRNKCDPPVREYDYNSSLAYSYSQLGLPQVFRMTWCLWAPSTVYVATRVATTLLHAMVLVGQDHSGNGNSFLLFSPWEKAALRFQ